MTYSFQDPGVYVEPVPTWEQEYIYGNTNLAVSENFLTVAAVADSNVTVLSGLPVIDGVSIANGQYLLLTSQLSGQSGIWQVSYQVWNYIANLTGSVAIQAGTKYKNTIWAFTSSGWVQISGSDVTSIFGRIGVVVAESSDYAEYYDSLGSADTAQAAAEAFAEVFATMAANNAQAAAEAFATTAANAAQAAAQAASLALSIYDPAGVGQQVVGVSAPQTVLNKRITRRVSTQAAPGATPAINTDSFDLVNLTGLATAITSLTTNLSGTPVFGDQLIVYLTDNGVPVSITWGAKFTSTLAPLPIATVASTRLHVGFLWNEVSSTWECVAVA